MRKATAPAPFNEGTMAFPTCVGCSFVKEAMKINFWGRCSNQPVIQNAFYWYGLYSYLNANTYMVAS